MLCETTTRVIPRALLQQLLLLLLLVVVSFACVAVEAGVDSLVGTEGNVMPAMWYKAPGTRGQVDDAHPVNGVELSNGDYAIVGKALRCEDCPGSEGFAVVVDGSTGRTKWQWTLNSRKDDVLNAVVEVPDGSGDVLVVGYQTVGSGNNSVAKRSVTRLQGTDGTLVWTSTSFGDSQRSHGAWEMITVSDDKSTILLSGVHKRAFREEMWFKSYGNVADGQAIVMEIPVSALGAPVRAESATWTKAWTQRGMTTAKAARPVPGGGVVVLLWGDDDDSSASLQHFNANRESLWGPTRYGRAHGEGTDVAVSENGRTFAITGHGCTRCQGELLGKLTKVRARNGRMVWSKGFASCDPEKYPSCTPIYNECWGVSAVSNRGFVLACGTGLEYCGALTGDNLRRCRREQPVFLDPRPGALPRPPAVWASLIVFVNNKGEMKWQRVDQYREPGEPKAGEPGWAAWSSASEYVIRGANGDLAFIQDEISGIGLLKLRFRGRRNASPRLAATNRTARTSPNTTSMARTSPNP